MDQKFLARDQFQRLIDTLYKEGMWVVGPRVKEGTIVYETIDNVSQLPVGYRDKQSPGQYELVKSKKQSGYFSWANGPQAIKPLTFTPKEALWQAHQAKDGSLQFTPVVAEKKAVAILGVRACDLGGLSLQDQHFLDQEFVDPYYESRREGVFLIAVNCSHPADTCFCHATGNGPSAKSGYDLVITELDDGFIISSEGERGKKILDSLSLQNATAAHTSAQEKQHKNSIAVQKRTLPSVEIASTLAKQHSHSRWDDVAARCLACGNCTSVCPSCFCHIEFDEPELNGETTTHVRQWSSCFSSDHSYIHGVIIRKEIKARYRQWLTHKFSSWVVQYGRSGCTGCGRCITWCPVGIDITEELKHLCESGNE